MSARQFLISGLIAGFLAGVVAFLVAHSIGEPNVNAAIAIEESHGAAEAPMAGHSHEAEEEVVSRATQQTWGLATGTLAVGAALGGVIALVAAGAMGRLGRFSPGQSTALVSALGLLSVSVVPFLKYPATPPAVGNPDTIGSRTGLYFGFLAISIVAAIGATILARRVWPKVGTYTAVLSGGAAYLLVVGVAAVVMPSVNEAGDFPAGILWSFRVSSLLTLVSLWITLGVVLTGLVLRLQQRESAVVARREFAASL